VENPDLIEFYGTECPHCRRMDKIVAELEKKKKITIAKLEVWHDEENKKILEAIPEFNKCRGVPFFFNRTSGKFICGECSLEDLEKWAE
jgi:thiol-disulfide isomerase/thioredoxin